MYFRVLKALENVKYENRETPVFAKAIEWIASFPKQLDVVLRRRLIDATCKAFSLSEAELLVCLDGSSVLVQQVKKAVSQEERFRALLPKDGWFTWYDAFTLESEPPLSYHIFSSLCVLGAALGRRVYRRMGHFSIFPNYCVILIGPTGRVKKTTAAEIAGKLIKETVLCPILADKVTPERMISVLKQSGHHFIHAYEMAVFFGKQRYNEGLITNFLRMLDCPAEFIMETQTREQEILHDLAITFLGCTTPSLLSTSMPEEITSSGFLNRFMLVVETDTERCFPTPGVPPPDAESKLIKTAERLKAMSGEMTLSKEANEWYEDWYRTRRREVRLITDDTMVEVMERTPTHLLRTAMLVHLVQCDHFEICLQCMQAAQGMVKFIEQQAPKTIQALKQNMGANDMDYVLLTIMKSGGAIDHSSLIRKVANKMNTQILKGHIRTLEEAGRVKVGEKGSAKYYIAVGGQE